MVHKLSQMILDRKLAGILDQGQGHLVVYESGGDDHSNFGKAVDIIAHMGLVVETLFARAQALTKTAAT